MGFLTSIMAAIGATATTAAAVAGGSQIIKTIMPEMPLADPFHPSAIPTTAKETAAETIAKATEQAKVATRQRQVAARRSRSIFSSPLGIAGEATTAKKYLLGQ